MLVPVVEYARVQIYSRLLPGGGSIDGNLFVQLLSIRTRVIMMMKRRFYTTASIADESLGGIIMDEISLEENPGTYSC